MTPLGRARGIWAAWPAAARIALIYIVARAVTTAIMLGAASASAASSRFGPDPTLGDYVLGWDAQWYWLIAVSGYPTQLPRDDAGLVDENAWAFLPVYPYLARIVGAGAWGTGALTVSLVAGWVACLGLHRLLRARIGGGAAMWSVALFANAPLAAMFQVGYAESLFMALLLWALVCLVERRWWWLYALVPLMGYTRPGVLAFALLLGLYGSWRWCARRAHPLPARDVGHILALGMLAVAVGFSWQVIAALVTGESGAYLQTELAWRRGWLPGGGGFVPFEGWVRGAEVWFTIWGLPAWLGYAALVAAIVAVVVGLRSRPARALGVEVRLWAASYLLYLLAVFFPQSSTFRLLLPLSPLWGAVSRSRAARWPALILCLGGQWAWIAAMYGSGSTFWQVP